MIATSADASPVTPDRLGASRAARRVARLWWFGLAPALAAVAAMRWLVPPRSSIDEPGWGWLAALGARHGLPLAVGFFLLFAGLARFWRDRLPLGRLLVGSETARVRTLPERITSVAVVALAALGALTLRSRVTAMYEVTGPSMLPTLQPGDTLIVNRRARQDLRRGDLVTFQAQGEPLVKRVIGLPGDRIGTRAGIPIINGWEVPHCDAGTYVRLAADGSLVGRLLVEWIDDQVFLAVHVPGTRSFPGYQVKPGEVFVLGDDRSNSDDSRTWNDGKGAGVSLASVTGRPWRVIGADREGRVDLRRLLEKPGLQLNLPGMDVRGLQSGLARCLAAPPKQTTPPPPRLESPA